MSDYLAVYVPKYPGRGNKYISGEQITRYLTGVRGLPATGHARAEDATRTAWILVNRYSLPVSAALAPRGRPWTESRVSLPPRAARLGSSVGCEP